MHRIISLSLFLLFVVSSLAQDVRFSATDLELQRLIQHKAFNHGTVAFAAMNLSNGQMIAEHNSYTALVPASVLKLTTTYAALKVLEPDHRFETKLCYSGAISSGTLNGNLIVVAGGDPTLGSSYFSDRNVLQEIKSALTDLGIEKINGNVIYDLSIFSPHTTPTGYLWEDMGNYFGATPTALMWRDNSIRLSFSTGQVGTKAILNTKLPEGTPFQIEHSIVASDEGGDNAWFFSAPMSRLVYGKGTLPSKQNNFEVKISDPDPVFRFHQELLTVLGTNTEYERSYSSIDVRGMQAVCTLQSPPLSEIITITNQKSVNLFAEALGIALSEESSGKSVEGGLNASQKALDQLKVSQRGCRRLDASGVSPMNRLSAQYMIDLLFAAANDAHFSTFEKSLAVGGTSGTFKWYFKESPLLGNVKGKSGTMKGTRNYAGYLTNDRGEMIAFSLFMNDYDEDLKSDVIGQFEKLLIAITQQ